MNRADKFEQPVDGIQVLERSESGLKLTPDAIRVGLDRIDRGERREAVMADLVAQELALDQEPDDELTTLAAENPLHEAADAGHRQMMLLFSAAFMRANKAYKSGGEEAAIKGIESVLALLPRLLLTSLERGGEVGASMLRKYLRTAEEFRALWPDSTGFDDHGREEAAGNYIKVRPEQKLREQFNKMQIAEGRQPLTEAEHVMLRSYMDGNYLAFNQPERHGGFEKWKDGVRTVKSFGTGGKTESNYRAAVATLNSALDKMPVHEGEVTRLAHLEPEQLAHLAERYSSGAEITERGFISATSAANPREISFGGLFVGHTPNVEFKIDSKTGRNTAFNFLSPHPYEKEVIFKSGTKFKVDRVEKNEKSLRIWMKEVPKTLADFRTAKAPSPLKVTIKMRFDARNPAVIAWARKHAAELVTDITETTRERIRAAVVLNQATGDFAGSLEKIAKAIGDPDRADLIARHETMLAANEGQRQAWGQAVDKGLLTGNEKRVWITTPDERLCPICEELDGQTADLDGLYAGEYDGPPAHVQCRCTEGIQ